MRAGGRILGLLVALSAAGQADASVRILSTNPCADAVLMEIADPARIVAISHYSRDARATSIPLAVAGRFRSTRGTAEEVIALRPDLVIGDTLMTAATAAAIRRAGIRLIQFPVPESVSESRAQIDAIAAALKVRARGAALNRRIDAAVAAVRARNKDVTPVSALIWQGGGLVLGRETLADELLTLSGFSNHSAAYGFGKWGVLPLERLIANPPAVLLTGMGGEGGGDRLLDHPAVRALKRRIVVRPLASRPFRCGGPSIIEALAALRPLRRSLEAGR